LKTLMTLKNIYIYIYIYIYKKKQRFLYNHLHQTQWVKGSKKSLERRCIGNVIRVNNKFFLGDNINKELNLITRMRRALTEKGIWRKQRVAEIGSFTLQLQVINKSNSC